MNTEQYLAARRAVVLAGFSKELAWANTATLCNDPDAFWREYVWVLCNSGMAYRAACSIFDRIMTAHASGEAPSSVFAHKGKAQAMEYVFARRSALLAEFRAMGGEDPMRRVKWCGRLPWIGKITSYHLVRNLGDLRVAKPDRHLQRIADAAGEGVQAMCQRLAKETGDTVGAVDVVLWRYSILKQRPAPSEKQGLPLLAMGGSR